MESGINILIREAEKRWLNILNNQINKVFKGVFLPSHDASHHRRIWSYAKEVLILLSEKNIQFNLSFVEGLLISVFFHDQGMITTRAADHGIVSRSLCEHFFIDQKLEKPDNLNNILEAIEKHDIKDKDADSIILQGRKPELLSLLSIADDIDALGIIGIYRYTEIYLHRGIDMKIIGIEILENIHRRFNNLKKTCSVCPVLGNSLQPKYAEIINFFELYNHQLQVIPDPGKTYSEHLGVVNCIRKFSVSGSIHPLDYTKSLNNYTVSEFVTDFFIKLEDELKKSA